MKPPEIQHTNQRRVRFLQRKNRRSQFCKRSTVGAQRAKRMVVSCNKCERVFVVSKTARLEVCRGCDVGYVCWMCRDETEDKPKHYCRDCEIMRKEQKKLDALKKKAEVMLDDWMRVNPTWEEKEKAEYLAAKASEAENKWNRYDKVAFIQNKLTNFIRMMRSEEEMKAAVSALKNSQ